MNQHDREEERRSLEQSCPEGGPDNGSARFLVHCNGDAEQVLRRAKNVLAMVLTHGGDPWPSDEEWKRILPSWFVERCVPDKSMEEAERWLEWWRTLPVERQAQANRENWSVGNWVAWFEPGERCWRWRGASVKDSYQICVCALIDEWPFAWGALEWLFLAAGAQSMSEDMC